MNQDNQRRQKELLKMGYFVPLTKKCSECGETMMLNMMQRKEFCTNKH